MNGYGWVQVYGQIVKESASGKAILFHFDGLIAAGRRPNERIWIPKKCFKTNDLGSQFISSWFWRKILDGTNGLSTPTKKELVAKYTRRIEANDEFFAKEKPEEPVFFGNVDKVLDKILN